MKLETFYAKTESLIPYARNSKQHPKEQINKIASQINQVGFLVPIIVDKDMVVIAGHGRLEAAKALGMDEVPIVIASHLTEEQATAFRIADNKVAESGWDMPMLAFELGTLERLGIDLELSGFDMAEARSVLQSFGGTDPSESKEKTGASEMDTEDYKEFAHTCPKCNFSWDE